MLLKDRIISSFSEINSDLKSSYLSRLRDQSINIFRENGFPSTENEEWRKTNINSIINQDYKIFSKEKKILEYHKIEEMVFLKEKKSFLLIFIDGEYNSFLSHRYNNNENRRKDIILSNISSQKEEKIKNFYGKLSRKYDAFNTLNTIFSNDGGYIYIPNNISLKTPIEILHIYTGVESKILLNPRNLIIVGESSKVKIIEHHKSLKRHLLFSNSVSEIYAFNNSQIEYYKIQDDIKGDNLIDNTFFQQNVHSKCSVHTFSFQGTFIRNNLNFYSIGENTSSSLYGISLLSGKQLIDHHTLIDHLYSNSYSFQLYKSILLEKSKSIFNGKILVEKGIKGINAFQKSNNILLSDEACIYAKPQLEIFSDEVKCSHGCTIGSFHESDLFYFQSRGIPEKDGKILLLLSILEEVLKPINILKLKNMISNKIKKKLGIYL
ncbi:Fe-S cluster assembly protein SufD [Blattabacterium sp. (Cryptocercus kyebangensis)]|uniref:Fe-S cluster assembly protein SufD n=1 Tax=Blattabacterium sp. (Cryptocercus kyebangensis) TaxID=298656 RepID=UPI000D7BCCD7|nr:Fe-S cluster assembly protein SufD [Blattabacterium sp. (Cryptocercus kyebangensis)]AWU43502.1 Fe-S cluster assembly protein SufD [Blattabacterium sp. (Cryptocercus kyebangensis)]